MALYLGNSGKLKLILNGVVYKLNVYTGTKTESGVRLLSSDNYILTDSNGVYLTVSGVKMLSADNYILKDLNDVYLTINENNLILGESD